MRPGRPRQWREVAAGRAAQWLEGGVELPNGWRVREGHGCAGCGNHQGEKKKVPNSQRTESIRFSAKLEKNIPSLNETYHLLVNIRLFF